MAEDEGTLKMFPDDREPRRWDITIRIEAEGTDEPGAVAQARRKISQGMGQVIAHGAAPQRDRRWDIVDALWMPRTGRGSELAEDEVRERQLIAPSDWTDSRLDELCRDRTVTGVFRTETGHIVVTRVRKVSLVKPRGTAVKKEKGEFDTDLYRTLIEMGVPEGVARQAAR